MSHRDMGHFQRLLFFPACLLLVLCSRTAQASNRYLMQSCSFLSNVSSSSQVEANIRRLVPELVSKAELNGYDATTYGKNKDKVYGLVQCRGDISKKDCRNCIELAVKRVSKECPDKADVRIWYDYCFLRYSLENFFNKVDTGFGIYNFNKKNVTDPETFNKKLGGLITRIESQAVRPENRGLGTGQVKLSPSTTLYALVQCTRDLSSANCAKCLAAAVASFPEFCENHTGCHYAYSSCYARYDLKKFIFPRDTTST